MITFAIGLAFLVVGGFVYGRICERVIKPTDNPTPAITHNDGVDYVPMKKWKNCLIQLLNIAGTGPIIGPIQGALFGPIAFITIPIGCVIGGAMHDYMSAMISVRNDGAQMPDLVGKYLGKGTRIFYTALVCFLLVLFGAVFTYTPGDIFVSQIISQDTSGINPAVWIVYGVIFAYYLIATLFPVDKIIGKIYPLFGGILLLSAVGIFVGIIYKGYPLTEIWETGLRGTHPDGLHFLPIFFVTVACGIVSGFHSTQATIVSRTVQSEKDGRATFYVMMIIEGLIAMIWAAAAMGAFNGGIASIDDSPMDVVGIVAKDMFGNVGGIIAIIGIIAFPITSGDTALRGLRLIVSDALKIDQKSKRGRLAVAAVIFTFVAAILMFAKINPDGFTVLWRYSAWGNQVIAVFTFAVITVYLYKNRKVFAISLIPGMFYMFIIISFIVNAKIGFNRSWPVSYAVGVIAAVVYAVVLLIRGKNQKKKE